MTKDFGEHGRARLEEIDKIPSIDEKMAEFVSRDDQQEPEGPVKWPFKRMLPGQLIVRIAAPPKAGAIIIPQKHKERPTKGTVIMVADDVQGIQVGDTILYSQFAGYLLRFSRTPLCRCMNASEVLAILNEDAPEIESEG